MASQAGESRIPKVGAAKDSSKRRSLLPAPKSSTRPGSVSPPHSGDDSGKPKPKLFKKDTPVNPPSKESSPAPSSNDAISSNESPEVREFTIGDHVTIAGIKPGVVKFFGRTHFGEGLFCGIELYDPEGKHDGKIDGVRYFTTTPGFGIFAPSHKVEYATSIPAKYIYTGTGSRLKAPSKLPGTTSKRAASKSPELDIEPDPTKDLHTFHEPRPSRLPSKLIKPRALIRPTPVNKESFASQDEADAWKEHVGDGDACRKSKPSRLPLQASAPSKPASKQTNPPDLPPLDSTYDVNDFKTAFQEPEDPNEIPVVTTPSRVDPLTALTLAYDLENSSGSDSDRDLKPVNKTFDLKREVAKLVSPTRAIEACSQSKSHPSKKDGGAASDPEDDYVEDDFDNLDLMTSSVISHASSLGILAEADICENNLITEDLDEFLAREDEISRDSEIDEKELENEISGISTPEVDMSSSTLSGKEICSSPDFDTSPIAGHQPEPLLNLTFDPSAVDTSTPAEPLRPAPHREDITPSVSDSEAGEKMASPDSSNSNSPEVIDKTKILLKDTTYVLSKGDDDTCRILDGTECYPEEMHMTKSMEGPVVNEMQASMELAKTAVSQLASLVAGAEAEKEVQHTKAMEASLESMEVSITRELDVVPEESISEEEVPQQDEVAVLSPQDYSLGSQTEHNQLLTVIAENEQVMVESQDGLETKQLMHDLEDGHRKRERPVSTISTCSADTGIGMSASGTGTEILSPRSKDRPLSLISTTSTDTGYQPDTDTEINTLAGSPDHSDVDLSPHVYPGNPTLTEEGQPIRSTKTLEEAYIDTFHSYQRAVMQGTERERPRDDGSAESDAVSNAGTLVADSGTDHDDSDMECCTSPVVPPVLSPKMPIEMAAVDFLDGMDMAMIGDKVPSAISEICSNPIVVMTTIPPPDNTVTMTTTTQSVSDTSVTMTTHHTQPECSCTSAEAMATLPDALCTQVTPSPQDGASTSHTTQEIEAATLDEQTIPNQNEIESIERNIEMCMETSLVDETKDGVREDALEEEDGMISEVDEEELQTLQTIEEDVCMSQSHSNVGHVCETETIEEVIAKVDVIPSESSCKMANGIGGFDKIEAERRKLEALADITCGNVSVKHADQEMLEEVKLKTVGADINGSSSGVSEIDVIEPKTKNTMHLLKIDVGYSDMSESTIKDAGPGEKGIKVVDENNGDSIEEKMEVEVAQTEKSGKKLVTKRKPDTPDSNKAAKSLITGKVTYARTPKKPDASDKAEKKPTARVGSRIDNGRQPPSRVKGKEPEKPAVTNPKTSKNVTNASNKKKGEGTSDKPTMNKLNTRRASAPPSPRIDTGNASPRSVTSKSAMSDIDESDSSKKGVKRTTPRSKWDNITSSIDSGKDKKAKPIAKAEVKSRINTGMSSPRNNPATSGKTPPSKTATNPMRRTSLAESRVKATGAASSRLRPDARGDSRMSSASDVSTPDTSRSNGVSSPRRPLSAAAKPGNRSATTLRRDRSSSTGSESQLSSISQVSSQGSKQTPQRSSPPSSTSTTPRTPRLATKRQSVPAIEVTPSKISTADKRRASVGVPSRLALTTRGKKEPTSPTPISTSTPFKKPATSNVNRNKTSKPTTTAPGTKRANQSNVSATAETTAEIARLEALCESRTKELTYAKMQLRAGITGFEAMAVLVNYMSTELDAFSCPAVTAGLREAQQNLNKAESQLRLLEKEKDALQAELTTLRQQYEAEKARLISLHKEQLETLEKRLKKDAEDQVQAVIDKHSHEVTTLNNFHERNLMDMKKEYERRVAEKEEEQKEEITKIMQENEQNMAELQKQHETRLEEFTMRFESIKQQLSEKVEMLRGEGEELRMREKTYMEKCQRDSDLKIQMSIAPYRHLPAEIESLTSVLDMRNKEIHDLRRQQLDLEKELEEIPKARDQIRALQQKVENLEAIISIKAEYERQLSEKHQKLLRKLDKESKTNKRLSMDNDELSWRLSAASECQGVDIMRRSLTHSPPGSATSTPVIMRRSLQHSPPARENNNFNIMSTSAPAPVQMRRKKSPRSPCETTFSFDQSPVADEAGSPPKTNLKRSGTYDLLDREDLDSERDHELRQSES